MRAGKLTLFFVLAVTFSAQASDISFLTHNLQEQDYIDEHGELRGKPHSGKRSFNLELVREMMMIQGHSQGISEVPFARGLKLVQNRPHHALFNVSRTPAREQTVKWVGPLQVETDYLYELKSSPTGVKSLEEAKGVDHICVLNGGVHHTTLTKMGFTNLYPKNSYVGCFELLKKGRIDLTPSASSTVVQKLQKANIRSEDVNQTPVVVVESGGYIAFSVGTPDEVISGWQSALDQLKRSGRYDELYRQYFQP